MTATPPLVAIAVAAQPDDHGSLQDLAGNYAGAFRRLGYAVEIVPVHAAHPDAFARLLRPEVRLIFSPGGWVSTPFGPLGAQVAAALERTGTPVLATIADQPFAPPLPRMLLYLPPRAAVFFIDPGFAIDTAGWIASGIHAAFLPCLREGAPEPDVDDPARTIGMLFVGRHFDPDAVARQAAAIPGMAALFRGIVDTGLHDYATPIQLVAAAVARSLGMAPDMNRLDYRLALNEADQFIRGRRREMVLRALLRHPAHVVTNRLPAGVHVHPGATVTGMVPYAEMRSLLGRARATLVCQPHFPGALNERIVHAMQAGCAVLSTPNPRLEQLFRDREQLWTLAPDLSDLDAKLEAAQGDQRQEVARRARTHVTGNHTPDAVLRRMLGIMRARGLLDADLPLPDGKVQAVPPDPAWRLASAATAPAGNPSAPPA